MILREHPVWFLGDLRGTQLCLVILLRFSSLFIHSLTWSPPIFLPGFPKLHTSHTPCDLSPPSRPSTSEPAENTGALTWGSTCSSLQCIHETLNTHPQGSFLPLLFFFFNYESITHLQEIWSPPLLKNNVVSQPFSGQHLLPRFLPARCPRFQPLCLLLKVFMTW